MIKRLVSLLFLASLALLLISVKCKEESHHGLVSLTTRNWSEYVGRSTPVLVKFFAPWCGHCNSLAPRYKKLAEKFEKDDRVIIAEIDADRHQEMIGRHRLNAYPTIKYFPAGSNDGEEVRCSYGTDALYDWVSNKLNQHESAKV